MEFSSPKRALIYGASGYIGSKVKLLLELQEGLEVLVASSRVEYLDRVEQEIREIDPDVVVNCAGLTGTPNVDWCEMHQQETIRANLLGPINIADTCFRIGLAAHKPIHCVYFGSGCIYEYDHFHPQGSKIGFSETEKPNYDGSFYSQTKGFTDQILNSYDNVLTLRLRMPVDDELVAKSIVTKLIKYEKVINVPNSMSVLSDLLPVAIDMILKRKTGTYNFVNPGVISHNEILNLYKKFVEPEFSWSNFSVDEQNKILLSKRSNTHLDTAKLQREYPSIPPIDQAFERVMKMIGESRKAE